MAQFADGSPYSYFPGADNAVNIGWLDADQGYPTGPTSNEFQIALTARCRTAVNRTRGWHRCPFCRSSATGSQRDPPVREADLILGDAEIRVTGADGVTYAAPNLILHYVLTHEYLPPPRFIQAVLEDQ